VPDLFAAVCSIAPTRRRRFLWVAWWTAPPERDPFRKPDAFRGGARTREEALQEAERSAGRRLVAIDARWARAWARILVGQPPWTEKAPRPEERSGAPPAPDRPRPGPSRASVWSILGLEPRATVEEIKRAFRKRALETHPDRGGDAEAFRTVRRAYDQALARSSRPARPKRA
jgi:hypothetical protein